MLLWRIIEHTYFKQLTTTMPDMFCWICYEWVPTIWGDGDNCPKCHRILFKRDEDNDYYPSGEDIKEHRNNEAVHVIPNILCKCSSCGKDPICNDLKMSLSRICDECFSLLLYNQTHYTNYTQKDIPWMKKINKLRKELIIDNSTKQILYSLHNRLL